ncbi:hypothetical protein AAUPMB_11670 [Pasteurella multocida subsp. multocida str. Anand1_buffalo]|nr:hypothetical protein AAUPMB_11670 [Pasteurella multocida subsp. multocida str. Anand1_buffalo]
MKESAPLVLHIPVMAIRKEKALELIPLKPLPKAICV